MDDWQPSTFMPDAPASSWMPSTFQADSQSNQPTQQQQMKSNALSSQATNPLASLTGYGANVVNQIPGLKEAGSAIAAGLGAGDGDTFGDRYNNLEQAQQSMRESGKQLYPGATALGEGSAILASMGAAPTPEMKGLSTLQKIGAGTATGTAYGAGYGMGDVDAYKPTDEAIHERLHNAKTGAEVGAVIGGGAQAVLGGAGALANSFTPDADRAALAQKAMDEHDIPIAATQLTPADQGKFTKGLTSAASEVPFNQAGNFAKQQRTAYNTAIARTFGEDISGDGGGKITPDVISNAYDNIGAKFDAAFKGKQIPISADKLAEIKGITDEADQYSTAPNIVQNAASKFIDSIGEDGTIPGDKLNNLRSLYGRLGKAQNDASPYIRQLRDSVIGLVDDPEAREQYKNLKIIEPLAAKSPDGYVQPSMLNNRLISSRYFPDYTKGGGGTLGDLARIGNTFLKDTVPNSGTAFRSKLNQLMYEAPLAMGAAAATGSMPAAAVGAATAIPLARGVTGLNTSQGLVRNLVNRGLGQASEIAPDALSGKLSNLAGKFGEEANEATATGRAFKKGGSVVPKTQDKAVSGIRRTGSEAGKGLHNSSGIKRLSAHDAPTVAQWSRLLHKVRKKGYNISARDRTNPAEVARVMRIR